MGSRVVDGQTRGFVDLVSSNWKFRLEGVQSLHKLVEGEDESIKEPEIVYRVLIKKFGVKENNFQVMNSVVGIFILVAQGNVVSPGAASLIIPLLSEKLGDIKVKKAAGECLGMLAEATTLGFVLGQSMFNIF
jgi:cytoskeleton-associated protein 5